MQTYESDNYLFHYPSNSKAEEDIRKIAAIQETCFNYISSVLNVKPSFKIHYLLCQTPEEVGEIYGDNEPCNGFASPPDKIYAVYNEEVKCIGFHEDAHLISYLINRPDNSAIREGLAMCFDRSWWGISNFSWTAYYKSVEKFIPIDKLLQNEVFRETDALISYPIVGAFTDWLIFSYGHEKYLKIYAEKDPLKIISDVYNRSIEQLSEDFSSYIDLIKTDEQVVQRMHELTDLYN